MAIELPPLPWARDALAPPPGEHVLKLLHRSGRTLALVRTKEGVRGHWLAADTLVWGDATPKLVIDPNRAFISPDHKRLVSFRESRGEATLVVTSPTSQDATFDLQ